MEIGTLVFMLALAYGLGLFWYEIVPGHVPTQVWRVMAYPFVTMVLAEVFVPAGPAYGGVHIVTAVGASLLGVAVDWAVIALRHPVEGPALEARSTPAHS